MNALLGKKFTFQDPAHFAHGRECEVIQELNFDFTGHGQKVPAVRFKILPNDGVTLRPLDAFLREMVESPAAETNPAR